MPEHSETIHIRKASHKDLPEVLQLFTDTIRHVCSNDYSQDQINAWVKSINNTKRWNSRIDEQYFIVAEQHGTIVGFASLEDGTYVDLLYVHKDYQRQGVGRALIRDLETESFRLGAKEQTSDVSITARPFFEFHGFQVIQEQTVTVNGVELQNFKMRRHLESK